VDKGVTVSEVSDAGLISLRRRFNHCCLERRWKSGKTVEAGLTRVCEMAGIENDRHNARCVSWGLDPGWKDRTRRRLVPGAKQNRSGSRDPTKR
jgi:hypothetical protein